MSPEILLGVDFSLPSDIFSLGVIFCEIISRHLVDSNTFKRQMPTFGLEEDEVREMASPGCPADFIQLSLDCCQVEPQNRPDMRQVIKRLRLIEQEVIQQEIKKGTLNNVGSLRGSSLHAIMRSSKKKQANGTRPKAPRLPSFEGQIKVASSASAIKEESPERASSESSDEDMEEALKALENVNIGLTGDKKKASKMALDSIRVASTFKFSGHGNPWWDDDSDGTINLPNSWVRSTPAEPLATTASPDTEDYSTSVVRTSKVVDSRSKLATTLSNLTVGSAMDEDEREGSNLTIRNRAPLQNGESSTNKRGHAGELSEAVTLKPSVMVAHTRADSEGAEGITQSFMTAHSHHLYHHADPSLAMATIASSIYEPALLYHRFTLIKNGTRRPASIHQTMNDNSPSTSSPSAWGGSLLPPQLILANALTKCNVCNKRLGFGAYMDCDDCPYKTHVGCGAMAEPNCQEMQIPNSNGSTPVVTPLNASRRGSAPEDEVRSTASPSAAAALAKAAQGSPSTGKKDKDAKSPPSSVSRGVNLFRKRNSKSPPPKTNSLVKA